MAKHRKPAPYRAIRKRLCATGVITASAAVPLAVAAPSASAATPNWGPIIACESGGNPTAHNPVGTASGLFQFLTSTWLGLGGGAYAPTAAQASIAQQYAIANKQFAISGYTAWAASRSCWISKIGQYTPLAAPAAPPPPSPKPRPQAQSQLIVPPTGSISVPGHTKAHVAVVARMLAARFGISTLLSATSGSGDHPKGLAIDFMVYGNHAKGQALADFVAAHRGELGVTYVMWNHRINFGAGWQYVPDRGSATANHEDHVHVSFSPAAGSGLRDVPAPAAPKIEPKVNAAPVHPPKLINPVPSPAPEIAAQAAPAHSAATVSGDHYTVVSGDCLSTIAARVMHSSWASLYEVNKNVVGSNPDLILPGQVLTIPG